MDNDNSCRGKWFTVDCLFLRIIAPALEAVASGNASMGGSRAKMGHSSFWENESARKTAMIVCRRQRLVATLRENRYRASRLPENRCIR